MFLEFSIRNWFALSFHPKYVWVYHSNARTDYTALEQRSHRIIINIYNIRILHSVYLPLRHNFISFPTRPRILQVHEDVRFVAHSQEECQVEGEYRRYTQLYMFRNAMLVYHGHQCRLAIVSMQGRNPHPFYAGRQSVSRQTHSQTPIYTTLCTIKVDIFYEDSLRWLKTTTDKATSFSFCVYVYHHHHHDHRHPFNVSLTYLLRVYKLGSCPVPVLSTSARKIPLPWISHEFLLL